MNKYEVTIQSSAFTTMEVEAEDIEKAYAEARKKVSSPSTITSISIVRQALDLTSFTPGRCAYAPIGHVSGRDCRGKLCFVVHDKRGCRIVCQHHADFRMKTSVAMGHSEACPYRYEA